MTALTAAERILMGLGISDPKEIDLEAIAWTRGALVEYRPLDGCEATIVGSARKAVIAVNSRSSPERRRFSVGHELGHWHHDRGRVLYCGSKDMENRADDALRFWVRYDSVLTTTCGSLLRSTTQFVRELPEASRARRRARFRLGS
jgi:hypothetical protein